MIFVLFGWATDTTGPGDGNSYPYVTAPPTTIGDQPEEPRKPDESEYGESEEGKAEYSEAQKKYDEDKKAYDEKKKKYDEDKKAYDEKDKRVEEKNAKGVQQWKEDNADWTQVGMLGMSGKQFADWRSVNGQFMAKLVVVIWLTYCVFTMLLGPTLKAVPTHFGKDFGVVITPLVLLGILYALAQIIDVNVKDPVGEPGSITLALKQFVFLIVNTITKGITNLNNFVFDTWHIPMIFITITATFGLQRIWGSKSKEE